MRRGIISYTGLGLVLLLVVVACGRKAVPSITTEVRDSIVIKEVPRLVEVKVPGETVIVRETVECDSTTNKPKPKRIEAASGRAKALVDIKADGSAEVMGGCDDYLTTIAAMDTEIRQLRTEKSKEVRVVTQYKTRGIDIFCRWFTCIVVVLVICYFSFRLNQLSP